MKNKFKDNIFTYSLLAPWIITFIVFWLFPLLYSAYLSFNRYESLTGNTNFLGFENYTRMFQDPIFWKALTNTGLFAIIAVPASTILALFMAVLLNSKMDGYINSLLMMLGLPHPEKGWLLEPCTSLLSIIILDVWINAGYYMVLFIAGMQTIPAELYEYAQLTGANSWQKFRRITLPLLRPTMVFVLLINTIKSFQVFVEILVMTKGGPMKSTTTLVYLIFKNAFDHTDLMGYASAMAYVLFFILLILSILQSKVMKEKV
ncbi:MAG: sugar ABC transporter permease [Candidatus Kapabacteria bacterium]|nr:sugar ABC transporter permease [Candidatus Kapabacteria bacterium]